jgi:hypothetical protein
MTLKIVCEQRALFVCMHMCFGVHVSINDLMYECMCVYKYICVCVCVCVYRVYTCQKGREANSEFTCVSIKPFSHRRGNVVSEQKKKSKQQNALASCPGLEEGRLKHKQIYACSRSFLSLHTVCTHGHMHVCICRVP